MRELVARTCNDKDVLGEQASLVILRRAARAPHHEVAVGLGTMPFLLSCTNQTKTDTFPGASMHKRQLAIITQKFSHTVLDGVTNAIDAHVLAEAQSRVLTNCRKRSQMFQSSSVISRLSPFSKPISGNGWHNAHTRNVSPLSFVTETHASLTSWCSCARPKDLGSHSCCTLPRSRHQRSHPKGVTQLKVLRFCANWNVVCTAQERKLVSRLPRGKSNRLQNSFQSLRIGIIAPRISIFLPLRSERLQVSWRTDRYVPSASARDDETMKNQWSGCALSSAAAETRDAFSRFTLQTRQCP